MSRLRSVGTVVFSLLLGALVLDWAHLRWENRPLRSIAQKCVETFQITNDSNKACIDRLNVCKDSLDSAAERANLILATKLQTVSLIKAASKGDNQAKEELKAFGWDKSMDLAGRRIAKYYDKLTGDENPQ